MKQPYQSEEEKNICEDYLNGIYINDLKSKYHHGNKYIHQVLEKYDIPIRTEISLKLEEIIVNDYKNGHSIRELEKKYHKSDTTISKILLKNGIEYTHCAFSKRIRQMTKEQIDCLLKEYQSGVSLIKLNEKYSLNKEAIKKLLRENNIIPRNLNEAIQISNRKYSADYNYFSKECSEMWYMVGFIAADGNIAKYSNSLDITLANKDGYLLEDIKKYLNFTGQVKYFETLHGDEKARLTITSKEIVNDLAKYNISRAKTFTFTVPTNLPEQYRRDFLLGYFDGDGSINEKGNQMVIVSVQKEVLETFLSWLEPLGIHGNIGMDKREDRKNTLYYLNCSHVKEIPIIYHYLYDNLNRNDLFLKRKKERFERNPYLK